jgi:hypothetical protein
MFWIEMIIRFVRALLPAAGRVMDPARQGERVMIGWKALLVATGLALGAAMAPAQTDVIFTFTQTGGNVLASGNGILDLSLSLSAGSFDITLTEADLLDPASFPPNTFGAGTLLSAPGGLPLGGLVLASPAFGFTIALLGDSFAGSFTSAIACRPFRGGPCSFRDETTVETVAVPAAVARPVRRRAPQA